MKLNDIVTLLFGDHTTKEDIKRMPDQTPETTTPTTPAEVQPSTERRCIKCFGPLKLDLSPPSSDEVQRWVRSAYRGDKFTAMNMEVAYLTGWLAAVDKVNAIIAEQQPPSINELGTLRCALEEQGTRLDEVVKERDTAYSQIKTLHENIKNMEERLAGREAMNQATMQERARSFDQECRIGELEQKYERARAVVDFLIDKGFDAD